MSTRWKISRRLLAVGGAVGVAWWAAGQLTASFHEREKDDRRAIAGLRERIAIARHAFREHQALERDATLAREEIGSPQGALPPGPSLLWFPKLAKEHFHRFGIRESVARVNTVADEARLAGYERTYWAVEMPAGSTAKEIRAACIAVAEIERLDPFIRVLDMAIQPSADDPRRSIVMMNAAVLSRKAGAVR